MPSPACLVKYVKLEVGAFRSIPYEIATGLGAFGEAHVGSRWRAPRAPLRRIFSPEEGPTTFRFLDGPMDKMEGVLRFGRSYLAVLRFQRAGARPRSQW